MSIKKINIKFDILNNNNPKNIVVFDTSEWAHIENKPSIIEITLPGNSDFVTHYFTKHGINYFNSENLGLHCNGCESEELELPDGVYTITVKGSPDNFQSTLNYLKTDRARFKLDSLFLKINFCNKDVDSDLVKQIHKIDLYIKSAEAHTRYGNICDAQELFFKAQQDIEKLQNCKNCI